MGEWAAASCAEGPSLAPTRSSPPDIAATVCPPPSWELRSEATTCTRTIRTRSLLLCPTLEQLACPPAWKSTPRALSALFPDGEPPLRVEALPVFSRRSTSLLCLTSTAVTPTDSPTSLTP